MKMNRYVVKKDKGWAVVNSNYKRSIKDFSTQQTALDFAYSLQNTKKIYLQGKDGKFKRIIHRDTENGEYSTSKNNVVYVNNYVIKSSSDQEASKRGNWSTILISISIIMIIIALVFTGLIIWEVTHD